MSGRAALGAGFILLIVGALTWLLADVPGVRTLSRRLTDHASGRLHHLEAVFESAPELEPGDPVYSVETEAFALQGRVLSVAKTAPHRVVIEVDPSVLRRFHAKARVTAMSPNGDLAWVMRTLLPPGLREEVLEEIKKVWEAEKEATFEALKGPAIKLVRQVSSVLVLTLPEALKKHDAERQVFFDAFQVEIFEKDVEPLLESEFVTRLEARLGPFAGSLGAEIWSDVSFGDLMGVTWVATKDLVGAAGEEEMAARLTRLLRRKALPVLRARAPQMLSEAVAAVTDGLKDPYVQEGLEAAAWKTLEHSAFQDFAGAVLDTWLLKNRALNEKLESTLRSPEFRKPLEDLYAAAEPVLEAALEEVLTRPDRKGMDHQLVRVLRKVVLKKDGRYLVLTDGGADEIVPGTTVLSGQIGYDR